MSRVTCHLDVPRSRAFELLEDPRALRRLVAGARTIRRFDPAWPDAGTCIHHTVGIPPVVVRDTTEVVEVEPDRRLLLDARVQFLGRFAIELTLEDAPGGGSDLTVREEAVGGLLGARALRRLTDAAIHLRNRELCRRFARLLATREANGAVRDA